MPRNPSITLTRRLIVEAALELMDRDGYAAFSMPKLGDLLGVRTPSLYHHFRDREDILAEVAKMVVLETKLPPRRPGTHWTEYFIELSVNFRSTILRHRNTAAVLLQFLPRDLLAELYETAAVRLRADTEVPVSAHVLILDGLERFTIGAALIESTRSEHGPSSAFPNVDPARQPGLAAAVAENELDSERLFVASLRAFLAGVEATTRTPPAQ